VEFYFIALSVFLLITSNPGGKYIIEKPKSQTFSLIFGLSRKLQNEKEIE
jgi:hypothetical protein